MSKPAIILSLFRERFDPASGVLSRPQVTMAEIQAAIRAYNESHPTARRPVSERNPANFFKDFGRRRANENWPAEILAAGYTMKQLLGEGNSFEFVPLADGQVEAFPRIIAGPTAQTRLHRITSAVIPLASRKLGRNDESWLIQVAVRLRVVETHLSLYSGNAANLLVVDHLQNSVKLHHSEIDAVFLATEKKDGGENNFIVTCEVKRRTEDITIDQILRQPVAIMKTMRDINTVLPIAIQSIGESRLRLVEFARVNRSDAVDRDNLEIVGDAIYELYPPVPGLK